MKVPSLAYLISYYSCIGMKNESKWFTHKNNINDKEAYLQHSIHLGFSYIKVGPNTRRSTCTNTSKLTQGTL